MGEKDDDAESISVVGKRAAVLAWVARRRRLSVEHDGEGLAQCVSQSLPLL
jgi:hypothetical protein